MKKKHANVFEQLYNREKKIKNDKNTNEVEYEQSQSECTFKPNISKGGKERGGAGYLNETLAALKKRKSPSRSEY